MEFPVSGRSLRYWLLPPSLCVSLFRCLFMSCGMWAAAMWVYCSSGTEKLSATPRLLFYSAGISFSMRAAAFVSKLIRERGADRGPSWFTQLSPCHVWCVSGYQGHAAEGQLEHELMLIVRSSKCNHEVRMCSCGGALTCSWSLWTQTKAAAFQLPQCELWMRVGHKVGEKLRMTEFLEFTDFAGIWLVTPFSTRISNSIEWHDLIGR